MIAQPSLTPATGLDPVVASLLPANPDEANLAAQYVAASAQALDCLRLAREHPSDVARFLKCTAQSASMMRQAHRWRTALLRAQAERQKRGPDPAAGDTAAPAEYPRSHGRRRQAGRAPTRIRAAANPIAEARPDRRGRVLRAPPPQTRRADPPPGPCAAETQLRPATARPGARHRHRHHSRPPRARQETRPGGCHRGVKTLTAANHAAQQHLRWSA